MGGVPPNHRAYTAHGREAWEAHATIALIHARLQGCSNARWAANCSAADYFLMSFSMSTHAPVPAATSFPPDARVAILAARFNAHIVDELLAGCVKRLKQMGLADNALEIHRVPGAFELPVAAKILGQSKRFAAVICLGCVIRGDTPHFDYVAGECARGIQQVALSESLPVIFGVLTTNTEEQARARTGGSHGHAGEWAANAAAEMVALARHVSAS
jgi:6,7-dimethyl-8-ribityllumazine synthase